MEFIYLESTDELYKEALDLRYDLFFRAPGLPREILFDALESSSFHIAAIENGSLCAYGRLSEAIPRIFKISQMVVRPDMQGQGLGTSVLTKLTHEALEKGAEEIYLNARLHAVSMYEKLGFKVSGQSYVAKSTGISHIKMVRRVKVAHNKSV
ncbi:MULTISPECIES: GNAT family N-acetyltransferase [unclassified Halomonas]|uniref:GNAT family N-acetyltransferase n=1 Tax=Halomonas sp. N3-2A TaxID=2014541 RepID=UPI000B5B2BEF|nr:MULTISPECIES: GNAT family N-acetyltransferase [unclassified Halomonas]ASK18734.1 GNAT family N-acetyltransferase [Halomonas sp. N3-2A]UTD54611.1 GNAT family N-acetyltransferase [Halomonas sp. MS1]